jgi:energy-coupling factor transporter transmembrane protein EcfT
MNPFAFEPGMSPLRKIGAIPKLFALVFLSLSAMNLYIAPLSLLAMGVISSALILKIDLTSGARSYAFLLYISLFSALVRGLFPGGGRIFALETLPESAIYSLRLFTVFIFAQVFFLTTRVGDVGDGITRAFRVLRGKSTTSQQAASELKTKKKSVLADPGILLYLSFIFLPKAFDQFTKVSEAAKTRGYGARKGKYKVRAILFVFQAFVFSNIKGALRTSQAMELRCYSPDRTLKPARWMRSKSGKTEPVSKSLLIADMILVFCSAVLFIVSAIFRSL